MALFDSMRRASCWAATAAAISIPALAAGSVEHDFTRLDGFDVLAAVQADGKGGAVGVGWQNREQNHAVGIIRGEDAAGQVGLNLVLDEPNAIAVNLYGISRLTNGDFAVAGSIRTTGAKYDSCYVLRLRANGQIGWRQRLGGGDLARCYFALVLGGGDLLVGGRDEQPDQPGRPASGALWRLDPTTGAVRPGWPHQYTAIVDDAPAPRSAFRGGAVLSDGSLVLAGWVTDPQRNADLPWLLGLASDGSRRWELHKWRAPFGTVGNALAEGVIPDGTGGAVFLGFGSCADGTVARGIAGAVGPTGAIRWLQCVAGEGEGADQLHNGVQFSNGRIVAVGATRAANGAAPHGWMVELDSRTGAVLAKRAFGEITPGELYGAAVSGNQRLVLVGDGRAPDRQDQDGWFVRLGLGAPGVTELSPPPPPSAVAAPPSSPAAPLRLPPSATPSLAVPKSTVASKLPPSTPIAARDGNLGAIDAAHPQIWTEGRAGRRPTLHYRFSLAAATMIEAVLLPEEDDLDLLMRPAGGGAPVISGNSGTAAEIVSIELGPGTHEIEIVGNADSQFRLGVRRASVGRASEAAIAMDRQQGLSERRLIKHGLELLGYTPGVINGVLTGETRAAIRAFQASLGDPPTGVLEDTQRLRLAVAAAVVAASRADAAATRAADAARSELAVEVKFTGGVAIRGDFGGDRVVAVRASQTNSNSSYRGQWLRDKEDYGYDGFGVFADSNREWAGEFTNNTMMGYGVMRRDGQIVTAGEWLPIGKGWGALGYAAMFGSGNPVGAFFAPSDKTETTRLARQIPY
jgi:hypothetical protein